MDPNKIVLAEGMQLYPINLRDLRVTYNIAEVPKLYLEAYLDESVLKCTEGKILEFYIRVD